MNHFVARCKSRSFYNRTFSVRLSSCSWMIALTWRDNALRVYTLKNLFSIIQSEINEILLYKITCGQLHAPQRPLLGFSKGPDQSQFLSFGSSGLHLFRIFCCGTEKFSVTDFRDKNGRILTKTMIFRRTHFHHVHLEGIWGLLYSRDDCNHLLCISGHILDDFDKTALS